MSGAPRHIPVVGNSDRAASVPLIVRGFVALLPLWVGAIPVGIAYAVAASDAGLSPAETQLMSLLVFSAAAQVSAVSLIDGGASGAVLIGTALALNAQLLLLGLAAARESRPSRVAGLLTAYFLTDGAYGVAAAGGRFTLPRLFGAGLSMFAAWNIGTGLGTVLGHTLPNLRQLGVDFVVPLTFLAVLVPLVRTRETMLTVIAAGCSVLVLGKLVPVGVAILGAGVIGSAAGLWWLRRQPHGPSGNASGSATDR